MSIEQRSRPRGSRLVTDEGKQRIGGPGPLSAERVLSFYLADMRTGTLLLLLELELVSYNSNLPFSCFRASLNALLVMRLIIARIDCLLAARLLLCAPALTGSLISLCLVVALVVRCGTLQQPQSRSRGTMPSCACGTKASLRCLYNSQRGPGNGH